MDAPRTFRRPPPIGAGLADPVTMKRRRRLATLSASLALHGGLLLAALLAVSGESQLGALFIDLTESAPAEGTRDAAGSPAAREAGRVSARAVHGGGPGGPGAEYGVYLGRLRTRVQESLRYPLAARRRGLSGTVNLEIVIRPDGAISGVAVTDSSSHAVLDDAAVEAIRRLAPEPFPPDVQPRALRVRLPVVFALE